MKTCNKCMGSKPSSSFFKRAASDDGLGYVCKDCSKISKLNNYQSITGLIVTMYNSQIRSSNKRNMPSPTYTCSELGGWLKSQKLFYELYDNWKMLGFPKDLKPSVDRLNDYLGYTITNIQLMTWGENKAKGHTDRKSGINNKVSKAVNRFSKEGNFMDSFASTRMADRETGVDHSSINRCCNGKSKSAGGYIWSYSVEAKEM